MSSRISEITLVVLLLVLGGFTRVYYGGVSGPMVVWKAEFGFKDTFVDVSGLLKLAHSDILRDHASVLSQLEDMGVVDPPVSRPRRKVLSQPLGKSARALDTDIEEQAPGAGDEKLNNPGEKVVPEPADIELAPPSKSDVSKSRVTKSEFSKSAAPKPGRKGTAQDEWDKMVKLRHL